MPRNVLIGTFGGGPLAISLLDCFFEFRNTHFDKIILVTTKSSRILKGYDDLKSHILSNCPVCRERYKSLEVNLSKIEMEDVITEEDHHAVLSLLIKNIHDESQSDTNIYLGLAGGRRSMNIIFAFAAMLFPVAGLYDADVRDYGILSKPDDWSKFGDDKKEAIYQKEFTLWGKMDKDMNYPPLTYGWHYKREGNFNLVQLPFFGLTPFLEAFIKQLKQTSTIDSAQDDWTTKGVDIIRQNQDVVAVIQSLQDLFETPIEEVTTPVLLWLEANDYNFWHDCIKWGTNNPKCGLSELKGIWVYSKTMLIANKIGDPLFREFDNLFTDGKSLDEVKPEFYKLYLEFNEKIINTIQERSKPLKEWLKGIAEIVYKEIKSSIKFTYGKEFNRKLTVCTSPDLDHTISEVMRNALQHCRNKAEISFTNNGIVISNDGDFDSAKWLKSPKSQTTNIVIENHQLKFDIKSIDGKVCATISWNNKFSDLMPVNVMKILKGGCY